MVKPKSVLEEPRQARTFGVFCIGECGRKIVIEVDEGLVFKQINVLCASCSKETKYVIPKGTATKFEGLPPGQTTIESAS